MAQFNFNIEQGSTFSVELDSLVETECSSVFTFKINANNADSITMELGQTFFKFNNLVYIQLGVETDWDGTEITIPFGSDLYIRYSISNSGISGYFNRVNFWVRNNTQSGQTLNKQTERQNDNALCGTSTSGDNLGNHIATQDLDLNNFNIENLKDIEVKGHSYADQEESNGNSGTSKTINWSISNFNSITLTDNCTFVFTNPSGPTTLIFKILQDATGSKTVVWPATLKWSEGNAPDLTTDPNAVDVISFYFDGANYYGGILKNMK